MESKTQKLLIATSNLGKIVELRSMLAVGQFNLVGLADFPNTPEVEETGDSFIENARLKAVGYAHQTSLLSIADDSGLEVESLGGGPGVLSARYGGENSTFAEKMAKLLSEMGLTGDKNRRARFVCAMAVADGKGNLLFESEGVCDGSIAVEPRGSGGFGYDPLFIPNGFDRTFGELSEDIKAGISHRKRAFEQIIPFLLDFNAS